MESHLDERLFSDIVQRNGSELLLIKALRLRNCVQRFALIAIGNDNPPMLENLSTARNEKPHC